MAPAVPCKTSKNSQHWVTHGESNEIKSRFACILEASESTRLRVEEPLPNYHEDHIEGKGSNSSQHYNLVHICSYASRHQNSCSESSGGQGMGNIRGEFRRGNLKKVGSKKEVNDEARTKGEKVHFASLMDIRHLKIAELEAKHPKYKG